MAGRHVTGSTLVIGANFLNHDSAIFCIDVEKQRVFGMATERLTRYKHDTLPPLPVVRELLRDWQIDGWTIQRVLVATSLASQLGSQVERGLYADISSLRDALGARYLKDVISRMAEYEQLNAARRGRLLVKSKAGRRYLWNRVGGGAKCVPFRQMISEEVSRLFPRAAIEVCAFDHHLAHAASGLVLSGFEDPLIVTLDGWGDGFFSKAFIRSGNGLQQVSASATIRSVERPERNRLNGLVPAHILATGIFDDLSLGHFYSIVAWLLGFEPVSDEGKVEALAAYAPADNEFLETLRKTVTLASQQARLVVSPEEAYSLYFDIGRLQDFVQRLGREAVAAAAQRFLEERALGLVELLLAEHPRSALIFTGGCAANVVLNMHIYERLCPNMYVVPAMGDDGTALGAAVLALKQLGVSDGQLQFLKNTTLPYFGNQHPRSSVKGALNRTGERVSFEDRTDWPEAVARFIHQGQIGAIYQGRMEWGPRALGNRSIVANPCLAETRHRINAVIKKRPLFQPLCPTILEEERERLFERAYVNRHMTCAFKMREEFWRCLPGAIHIDGTARAQFLAAADNPMFYRLLAEFKRLSGFGVVINTSFNLHGRTIVNTPDDALDDFLESQMDFLILDGYLVRRLSRETKELPKTRE